MAPFPAFLDTAILSYFPVQFSGTIITYVSTFIRELTKQLVIYHEKVNINVDNYDIKLEVSKALDSSRQISSIISIENVEKLVVLIGRKLREITGNRSVISDKFTRFYMRYFAKMLSKHLSDWLTNQSFSQNDLLSSKNIPWNYLSVYQNIVATYFDIFIAFVILEERIQGKLSASESILIMRERRKETNK